MIRLALAGVLGLLGAVVLRRQRRLLALRCAVLERTNLDLQRAQRELERESHALRIRNERLLQTDRYKDAFMAAMGHEFRTPLNAILGFAEVLQEGSVGALNDRQAKYVSNIHLSGRHLLRLVNEVLDLSRIEAGQMRLSYSRFPVERLLREAETILRGLADRKGVELSLSLSGLPPGQTLTADEERIKEVLLNLMANSIRFTPATGRVAVCARVEGDRLCVEVVDTGIGIAPADQERIFQAFQQVDPIRARDRRGTGLGLALARRFVELHQGAIGVQSEPERGSTFWFSLPLAPPELVEIGTEAEAPRRTGVLGPPSTSVRPLVLIAEDDPRSAELLGLCLRKIGYTTVYAADGVETLAKARALSPSVISLDIMLPSADGWEVLRRLRVEPGLADIPVVIVSALDQRERGLETGAYAHLVKPVEPERIIQVFSANELRRSPGHEVRIRVAGRDPAVVDALRSGLEAAGFAVAVSRGPVEAVRAALAAAPDLLVLAVSGPRKEEQDALRTLRDDPVGRTVPVLLVLADELDSADAEGLQALAGGWLSATVAQGPALVEDAARLIGRQAMMIDER